MSYLRSFDFLPNRILVAFLFNLIVSYLVDTYYHRPSILAPSYIGYLIIFSPVVGLPVWALFPSFISNKSIKSINNSLLLFSLLFIFCFLNFFVLFIVTVRY